MQNDIPCKSKNQLKITTSLRARTGVAIRSLSGPGRGRAMLYIARDADCHGLRPRNDSGRPQLVLLFCSGFGPGWSAWAVPHALQENMYFIAKKCLHFPNIHARISNVNIKSIDRVVVFSAHVLRESGAVGATQHGKQGFPPGAAA